MRVGLFTRTLIVGTASLLASSAGAQMNPELGDVGGYDQGAGAQMGAGGQVGTDQGYGGTGTGGYDSSMQGQVTGWDQSAGTTATTPMGTTGSFDAAAAEPAEEPADSGESDHAKVAGRLGFGFFGTVGVPILLCGDVPGCAAPEAKVASAPTVGARYWLDEGMGIEAALGVRISSGETSTEMATVLPPMKVIEPSITALALHGGLPIALAHSGHFAFELVPQLNFGFSTGSYSNEMPMLEWSLSGLLIEVGAKIGAEIHFGFIDIPQLSLQGTVGLGLRMESRSAEQTGTMTTVDNSHFQIATSVDGDPWDIFTGSITAIYYL